MAAAAAVSRFTIAGAAELTGLGSPEGAGLRRAPDLKSADRLYVAKAASHVTDALAKAAGTSGLLDAIKGGLCSTLTQLAQDPRLMAHCHVVLVLALRQTEVCRTRAVQEQVWNSPHGQNLGAAIRQWQHGADMSAPQPLDPCSIDNIQKYHIREWFTERRCSPTTYRVRRTDECLLQRSVFNSEDQQKLQVCRNVTNPGVGQIQTIQDELQLRQQCMV